MKIAAILATAGLTFAATAQRNAIDIKVRLSGDEVWADSLNYVSPIGSTTPAHVEVGIFYERATGYGFSGAVHNVLVHSWDTINDVVTLLDRPDSAQHPDGRQGRFNFGAQRQAVYLGGVEPNKLRIAAANNTQDALGGGISVKQNTPSASGSNFDTSNPVLAFRFDVTLACRPSGVVTTYDFEIPVERVANFAIYSTQQSTNGTNVSLSSLVLDGAAVQTQWQVVPAPGALAIAGLASLAAARRKR